MLPNELQYYLRENKARALLGGYIQLLDNFERKKYSNILLPVTKQHGGMEVFARTAFADFLTWDGKYVFMFRLSDGNYDVILSGFSFFFQNIEDREYQDEYFDLELFKKAEQRVGPLRIGESYAFEPLPLLGGGRSVNTIVKNQTEKYVRFLVSFY